MGNIKRVIKERSGVETPLHLAKSGLETNLVEREFLII